LHSYELYQLDLDAQLVVLSGCNTGFGLLQKEEGLLSLARSFFYSGVRSVAFTLWPMADKSGALLVKGFYKGIVHGKLLDEALQSAKLEYLADADPAKCHPYYWAGFVILGRTDPVLLHRRLPSILYILLISVACGTGILAYRKFKT
jgi:CHAT domain-containing protein